MIHASTAVSSDAPMRETQVPKQSQLLSEQLDRVERQANDLRDRLSSLLRNEPRAADDIEKAPPHEALVELASNLRVFRGRAESASEILTDIMARLEL